MHLKPYDKTMTVIKWKGLYRSGVLKKKQRKHDMSGAFIVKGHSGRSSRGHCNRPHGSTTGPHSVAFIPKLRKRLHFFVKDKVGVLCERNKMIFDMQIKSTRGK